MVKSVPKVCCLQTFWCQKRHFWICVNICFMHFCALVTTETWWFTLFEFKTSLQSSTTDCTCSDTTATDCTCSDVRESVRATQIVKLNYIGEHEHFVALMALKFQEMFALLSGNGSERRLRTTIALPTAFLATFYLYVIVIKQISRWKI